jgi:hypothetical protein
MIARTVAKEFNTVAMEIQDGGHGSRNPLRSV